jgi:hypothetical protein
MTYARIWMRGFLLVALVAMNTRQVASGQYVGAFICGGLISLVWWRTQASTARTSAGRGRCMRSGRLWEL